MILPNAPQNMLDMTVPQLLAWQAAEQPTAIALSAHSVHGYRDRLSFAQLVYRMEAMAAGLFSASLGPGARIGIYLDNHAGREAILISLGAFRLAAAVCPLNTRYSDDELSHAVALVEPHAIVTRAKDAERLQRLAGACPILTVDANGAEGRGFRALPVPGSAHAAELPEPPTDSSVLCSLLFTSGTTARPKAVMHSQRSMLGAGLCCGTAMGIRPGDLYQGGWPFFTSSALNLGCATAWASGAGVVLEEPLDNAGRLNLIAQERSTFYHAVPSVLRFLIDEYARGRYDVTSLRRVGYGGSAMPAEVSERIAARWPHVEQVQIYGTTESGPCGTVLPPEMMRAKHPSVGRAMSRCELRIVDANGETVPQGASGEIVLIGPAVAQGYFRNPEASQEAFSCGGVRTGDVGCLDEDGFLYFTDRLKDVINRGGLKIASVAVEEVLYRSPDVAEAAVVAVPHQALGEDIGACIVPAPGADIDTAALHALCAAHLADYECPRHWLVLDELPKTPLGKVLKTELRKLMAAR